MWLKTRVEVSARKLATSPSAEGATLTIKRSVTVPSAALEAPMLRFGLYLLWECSQLCGNLDPVQDPQVGECRCVTSC